ncbi:aminotransferase class I/II-fold pyridoxal phosphate-dependent enzyme [Solibacillus sp. FSL H8-0538]|uniref:aminotransferase class I/II-fold pyridoxal phosphate-dependent enzyme n=1 Tax=Solibacillus sp. FSL H8-0538 TaxID=2921400 RepID=UPI0030FB50DD
MKNERPIVEALQKFVASEPQSLHVPGHKHGVLSALPNELKTALTYDVTELSGLDDFHHPEEAIASAELLLTKTYGADRSFFLVNGSTVGNLAMIYATCQRGDIIIVQRNAHKSVFHGIELVGAKPVYVTPQWDLQSGTAGSVSTEVLKEALQRYPNAKAVILTYPTYYGIVSQQLAQQIALCHEKHIPVLVDEAHGAHLIASKAFPVSALNLGADVVVQSAHKTLPAMTMASFLHIKSSLIQPEKINGYLRMLQSSSPSYLLLASLDDARHYVSTYLESDSMYLMDKRQQLVESLRSLPGLVVVEVDDPLKLLLRAPGYTGFQLKDAFENNQLYVELADAEQVLIILPLLKHGQSYPFGEMCIRIKDAVAELKKQKGEAVEQMGKQYEMAHITTSEYTFAEIGLMDKEWIPYMRAIGRVAASMLIPYPPGIPLFVPGEKITVAKLSQLEELLAMGAAFQGVHRLQEKLIYVIKH